jgi:hypothetical protein
MATRKWQLEHSFCAPKALNQVRGSHKRTFAWKLKDIVKGDEFDVPPPDPDPEPMDLISFESISEAKKGLLTTPTATSLPAWVEVLDSRPLQN